MEIFVKLQRNLSSKLGEPGTEFYLKTVNIETVIGMVAAVEVLFPQGGDENFIQISTRGMADMASEVEARKSPRFNSAVPAREFLRKNLKPNGEGWIPFSSLLAPGNLADIYRIAHHESGMTRTSSKTYAMVTQESTFEFNTRDFIIGYRIVLRWFGQKSADFILQLYEQSTKTTPQWFVTPLTGNVNHTSQVA